VPFVVSTILHEIVGVFVDRVVSQMHKQVGQVGADWGHILGSREPC
jgi:hypothetical protein